MMKALILEDDRDRRVAMIGRLADRFPFMPLIFFDASADMIECMSSEPLDDVAVIALDHDLELIPGTDRQWIDPGTGLDVAQWLADHCDPFCPIIVHTTNQPAGDEMTRVLQENDWTVRRVVPHDDLSWVDSDWFPAVRNAIVASAPALNAPGAASAGAVDLLRAAAAAPEDSESIVIQLVGFYQQRLQRAVGSAKVELVAIRGESNFVSVLPSDGPVLQWAQRSHVSLGDFDEWARRGGVAIDDIECGREGLKWLTQLGVAHLRVELIEIANVQALLIVSSSSALAPAAGTVITELKHGIEVAICLGDRRQSASENARLTQRAGSE